MNTHKEDHYNEDKRIALLEQSIGGINQTLIRIEKDMKESFAKVDDGFAKVNNSIEQTNNRLWYNFYWSVAGFSGILMLFAHAQHWI